MSSDTSRERELSESDARDGLFETAEAVELYVDRIEDPALFPQERKAVDRFFNETDAAVLDVGCGVGRVSSLLHDRGFDVTGIDISEPFIKKARSLFPEIDFRVADITDTSFDAASFDYVVFSFFGLDYIKPASERGRALREICRLLKPSGILLFSTHNSWHPLVPRSVRDFLSGGYDVFDMYLREENRRRIGSRYKTESVPLGRVEIYLSNPAHQWRQLHRCGLTPLDVVGRKSGVLRFFERQPHFVAKK